MARSVKTSGTSDEETPMMQQYLKIKRDYPDAILFYRMGDFYEMFFEDAKKASRILEIALTSRNKGKENPVPMCGIPHHSAGNYIAKLIKSGETIALCEQTEDPKKTKGLVKREVLRVITPGTIHEENLLDPKSHNFLVAVVKNKTGYGLASVDITTGLFRTTQLEGPSSEHGLTEEILKLEPKEVLIPESISNGNGQSEGWPTHLNCRIHPLEDWHFNPGQARTRLLDHFKTQSLEGFGCDTLPGAISAAGALLHYIQETRKTSLKHINSLTTYSLNSSMQLDPATVQSLELVVSSDGERQNSLLGHLDATHTPMGSRRLKEWILKPLLKLETIQKRLSLVQAFHDAPLVRQNIREQLNSIYDLERLLGRIASGNCSPRDLVALKQSLSTLPRLHELLSADRKAFDSILSDWENLNDVHELIATMLVDDPPFNLKDGHLIKDGCDAELDRLKGISRDGNKAIAALEAKERERTNIPQLKVGYNKIYGYFLEVTKKNLDRVPEDYIRKQSLVNAERYISPELKELEQDITGAEEKIKEIEHDLFERLCVQIGDRGVHIQKMAKKIGKLDAVSALAEVAHRKNYCPPQVNDSTMLKIENGRHPLVESIDSNSKFIPNDTHLDCEYNQVMIITGPNMAGKSTYLRQVALITLMAQIGSYVPAESATVGIVDRIFSRVGAQDHLLRGQSTFMVEMNETANILNHATERSLIILDEIGRGTSTFDGLSIAWSIVEYLHGPEGTGAKTLFATHYHELTELALLYPGVQNFSVQVKEWNDEIIFLRKIAPGAADKSYGIQVARLAGLPESVLTRAREVLHNLENKEFDEGGVPKIGLSSVESGQNPQQLGLFQEPSSPVIQKLKSLDPDNLSPRQALEVLYELNQLLKGTRE